jgi:hypothetical protein
VDLSVPVQESADRVLVVLFHSGLLRVGPLGRQLLSLLLLLLLLLLFGSATWSSPVGWATATGSGVTRLGKRYRHVRVRVGVCVNTFFSGSKQTRKNFASKKKTVNTKKVTSVKNCFLGVLRNKRVRSHWRLPHE